MGWRWTLSVAGVEVHIYIPKYFGAPCLEITKEPHAGPVVFVLEVGSVPDLEAMLVQKANPTCFPVECDVAIDITQIQGGIGVKAGLWEAFFVEVRPFD